MHIQALFPFACFSNTQKNLWIPCVSEHKWMAGPVTAELLGFSGPSEMRPCIGVTPR